MKNRIGYKLISLIVAMIFCLQGCIWRTISVDEQMRELSRKPAEIGREYKIDLVSQSSVRVYEELKMGNEVTYEVIDVKRKGRAAEGEIVSDIFISIVAFPIMLPIRILNIVLDPECWRLGRMLPASRKKCPGPRCPVEKTVTKHKGTTIKHENINYKEISVSSGNVGVYINNKHRTDIPIDSDGIAKFNCGLYPVDLKGLDKVPIRFKYKDAVAVLTIPRDICAEAIR